MTVVTHGHRAKGRTGTYNSWRNAKHRCFSPSADSYPNYGGRGVTMCREWVVSFAAFLRDMGERPANTTLDRVDPNGNYEPLNCRWATPQVQSYNKRL